MAPRWQDFHVVRTPQLLGEVRGVPHLLKFGGMLMDPFVIHFGGWPVWWIEVCDLHHGPCAGLCVACLWCVCAGGAIRHEFGAGTGCSKDEKK